MSILLALPFRKEIGQRPDCFDNRLGLQFKWEGMLRNVQVIFADCQFVLERSKQVEESADCTMNAKIPSTGCDSNSFPYGGVAAHFTYHYTAVWRCLCFYLHRTALLEHGIHCFVAIRTGPPKQTKLNPNGSQTFDSVQTPGPCLFL